MISFTLEELLSEDDVIQECKYMNSNLIEYLARPEVVDKLVRYVITNPEEEIAENKVPTRLVWLKDC